MTIIPQASYCESTNNQPPSADARAASNYALSSSDDSPQLTDSLNALLDHVQFLSTDALTHFRYADSGPGKVTARDEYYKISTRMQINLVGDGTTYLQLRGESGRGFNSSTDYTGLGLHNAQWSFNLKSLYLGQKIGNHMEAQAGGIEFDRGAGSEATSADNDGYLEGYRLTYAGLGHNLPDRVSVTIGYVGDFTQPNVFARLPHMGDENYVQVMAAKRLGKNRDLSAEYNSLQGIRYTREAFRWQKIQTPIVNDFSLEALTRASDNPTFGWFSTLGRNLPTKMPVRAGVFYSDMPKGMFQYGSVQVLQNGDFYALGKRIGPSLTITPFKNFDLSLMGGERLDNTPGTRYRGQIQAHYQLASLLNRVVR
ncbi:MAG TPA: hypothetical protein VMH85_14870 [Terriglobales bacterium]|nr:hypothetical protein [Terriglobales bacterium]